MFHLVLLIGAATAIYVACEWFVNAVEWLGLRLKVGRMAVGTVLAAVGTALAESVVTLVAVAFGATAKSKDIGVGAAMGGPLVLSTIAYAVVGVLLWSRGKCAASMPGNAAAHSSLHGPLNADLRRLAWDQRWFLCVFVVKVALGLVAFAIKPALGLLFFATYAVYFRRELANREGAGEAGDDLALLKLQPMTASPSTLAIGLQTAATLDVIFATSQVFVKQLEWAGNTHSRAVGDGHRPVALAYRHRAAGDHERRTLGPAKTRSPWRWPTSVGP